MTLLFAILLLAFVWGFWWLGRHPQVWQQWLLKRLFKRMARQAERRSRDAAKKQRDAEARGRRKPPRRDPVIPREYAQDIEFTETRIFTQQQEVTEHTDANGNTEVIVENQVSDIDWVEIRNTPHKK